jgi:hypothetical protein
MTTPTIRGPNVGQTTISVLPIGLQYRGSLPPILELIARLLTNFKVR